jgi:hypothetical protein
MMRIALDTINHWRMIGGHFATTTKPHDDEDVAREESLILTETLRILDNWIQHHFIAVAVAFAN